MVRIELGTVLHCLTRAGDYVVGMWRPMSGKAWVQSAGLAVLLIGAACGGYRHVLFRRAAFDLNCPEESLVMHEFGPGTRGVAGCGRRATYVEQCGPPTGYVAGTYVGASCGWVMDNRSVDSESLVQTPAVAPPPPAAVAPAQAPSPAGSTAPVSPEVAPTAGGEVAPTAGGEVPTAP